MTQSPDERERERLDALRSYDVLDTDPEREFDDLVHLAARTCETPMALLTLVDAHRQWFKARVGFELSETPIEQSICATAMRHEGLFTVPDLRLDEGLASHPLVTGAPHIRFYAGMPLIDTSGLPLGTLCVLDTRPRELTSEQKETLRMLGTQVMSQLDFRRTRGALERVVEELSRDVTERRRAEDLLKAITEGTGADTGPSFYASLVRYLARALQVRRVVVAECIQDDRVRARAVWLDNDYAQTFEYPVKGTPCEKVVQGETCLYPRNVQQVFPTNRVLAALNAQSYLGVPLFSSHRSVIGHMMIVDDKPMSDDPLWLSVLRTFAARAGVEIEREQADERLRAALAEVERLKNQLQAENVYLQEEIRREHNFEDMVGNSPALLGVLRHVELVADTDATVLVQGETGTGKELIARALHSSSRRRQRPLVKVNCGAIPPNLIESELFGHVKGAFTGAFDRRVGRFELADGGTLFLDEVGELPLDTQVKLLRVLQEQEFEPVGGNKTVRVDVRIIAATNRDLTEEVRAGRFRSDLFFRLNVVPLSVPPLRDRPEDIPLLVTYFVSKFAKKFSRRVDGVTRETMAGLVRYPWPGNVRELQNVVERAVVLSKGPSLSLSDDWLPVAAPPPGMPEPRPRDVFAAAAPPPPRHDAPLTMDDADRRHIEQVLMRTGWVIEGPSGAAQVLKLHPNTLRSRMKKLGLRRPRHEMS
jgi:transcriptional regulator with GAF, ATPase, and Fis domain